MSLEPGTLIGRFRITRLLAQGGMAEVYRAEQELTGGILRPSALKVIRPEYSESADFREMFLDEARLACTLSHPNIVHIYEVGESDGRLFMAMELVPGESLAYVSRQLREKGERFSDEALVAIGIFTCSALEAVHALRLPSEGHVNLVHRDVSPHNLLLGPSGSLKLIDFGIAKAATNRNLTSPGVTKGKAGYFSPEQAMGKLLDGRSDLFSLGVTLYKLAWGGTPFDAHKTHHERNTALVHGRWRPLREVCPGLPPGFYDVVDRALAVRPGDRFANASEMRTALERLALTGGFHVGQSTLAGYLPAQGDDPFPVVARPQPSSARQSRARGGSAPSVAEVTRAAPPTTTAAPASVLQRRTQKMRARSAAGSVFDSGRDEAKTRRKLLALSAGAGVVLATVAVLVIGSLGGESEEAAPLPAAPPLVKPVAVADPPRPRPEHAAPPPVVEEVARVAAEPAAPPPAEEEVRAAKPKALSRREPARRERTEPVAAVAVQPVPKPAAAQPAPPLVGDGRLRIGGSDDGEVEVNGKKWGISPLDRKVPAGTYEVLVKSLDGKQHLRQSVEVRPDRTALVRFDFASSAITVGGN